MKKFIWDLSKFSALLIVIGNIICLFISPYYGNPDYKEKHDYLTTHETEFNAIILGSSRLYRQINPQILDSLLNEFSFKAFNLAAPATYNPETYYLYEKFLQESHSNIKYAIVELQQINEIPKNNLLTTRNYYWHNLEFLNFSISYILGSKYPELNKRSLISSYAVSFLVNIVNPFKYKIPLEENSRSCLGKKKDGYLPLDDQSSQASRHLSFKNDTSVLFGRISISKISFEHTHHEASLNKVHLKKLIDLLERSKAKGITLYFIIPPKLPAYDELLALKEALPSENVIEIADYNKYNNLYQAKYSFDVGHLNKAGASLFSEYLAQKIIQQQK
jgi:hypothetical protein